MEKALAEVIIPPIKRSRLMETEPVAIEGQQDWYLNRIITGFFLGTPARLLEQTQLIERLLGRTEKGTRAPRTADIDILLFDNFIVTEKDLVLPHPAIDSRRFCIEGLFELVPDKMIPGIDRTVAQLFNGIISEVREQRVRFL
jgi:2-amino-4-hydroxy-6-hydroxymethyldihydropteridine diphosphokinase